MPRAAHVWIGILFAAFSASPSTGHAAPSDRLASLVAAVDSEDPSAAIAAIEELSKQPVAVRVPLLTNLLRQGQRDVIAEHLVLSLGASRSELAIAPLQHAASHRLAAIRVAALHALGNFRERADVSALVALGLRDSDPAVRAAAADSLATMNARTEVPTLLVAFARGVPEAAAAIGTLADESALPAFTAFLGHKPLAHMLAGYRAWLIRNDVRVETKLTIVATLEEVSGLAVKRFLQSLVENDSAVNDSTLRRALTATIARIPETNATGSRAP